MSTDNEKKEAAEASQDVKTGKKRSWKKILGVTAVSAVVLFAVIILALDIIVAGAVRNIGPLVTGTPVELDSVSINLFRGRVELKGFRIGNPEGYQKENAFELEKLVVHVEPASLFTRKIMVPEITVNGVMVDFEVSLDGSSNLADLKNNMLKKAEEADAAAEAGVQTEAAKEPESGSTPAGKKENPQVVIALLDFSGMQVCFGNNAAVPIPGLRMENLGGGRPLAEQVNEFFVKLIAEVSGVAAEKGIKALGDNLRDAVGGAVSGSREELKSSLDKLKKLF